MNNHLQSLKSLSRRDPVMRRLIRQAKLQPVKLRKNYFASLVRSIISQQLSTKAARSIFARFAALFGKKFPTPRQIIKSPAKKLRSAGLSAQKVLYIKELAKAAGGGRLNFRKLAKASDEAVIEQLIRIKGIGRWTAEMFLIFSLGRPNVFSRGDLGLKNAIKKLYRIDPKLHQRKLKKLLDTWHPHQSLASRHLWASLNNEK